MAKLHVPAPDAPDDRSDMYLAFLAGVLLLILAGIGMYRAERKDAPRGEDHAASTVGEAVDPLQVELKAQRRRAEDLAKLGAADLEAMDWSEEDQRVAFRFGPRLATEVICRKLTPELEAGTLGSAMRLELEKTLDRRTEFAPWTCMSRLYLAGKLPEGDLRQELDEFWGELDRHEGNARIPISILTDFRETRDRPDSPRFYAWARMCAIDFEYQVGTECRRLLHQISPAQGGDLLGMLEEHWTQTGVRAEDMPAIVDGLGYLARNGQPHNWRVTETTELPDYDVDFRQGVVGYLCRMVHTPTPKEREGRESPFDAVAERASHHLGKVGLVGARAYEEKLLMRWREACRLAFGGHGGFRDGEERVSVPLLAVWDGNLESVPDYRLTSARELGTCVPKPGYPLWSCLSGIWKGEGKTLDRAVAHFFIETRYMEWDEAFDAPPKASHRAGSPDSKKPSDRAGSPDSKKPSHGASSPDSKKPSHRASSPDSTSGDAPSSTPEPPAEASPTAEP